MEVLPGVRERLATGVEVLRGVRQRDRDKSRIPHLRLTGLDHHKRGDVAQPIATRVAVDMDGSTMMPGTCESCVWGDNYEHSDWCPVYQRDVDELNREMAEYYASLPPKKRRRGKRKPGAVS